MKISTFQKAKLWILNKYILLFNPSTTGVHKNVTHNMCDLFFDTRRWKGQNKIWKEVAQIKRVHKT